MKVIIGSKYEERKKELSDKVLDGTAQVLHGEEARETLKEKYSTSKATCYFCRKSITENLRLIVDKETREYHGRFSVEQEEYYPIDAVCYGRIKGISLKRS